MNLNQHEIKTPSNGWKWLDVIFVLRPTLFFPCWTLYLAGIRLSGYGGGGFSWRMVFAMVVSGAALGVVYLVNQLRDVGTDRINRKLPYFSQNIFPIRTAWWEVAFLLVFSLVGAVFLSWRFLVIVIGGLIVTGLLYNYAPFQWKDKPIGSLVAAFLGGGLAFLGGSEIGGGLGWISVKQAIPYLFAFTATSLWTAIPDREGDKEVGKCTFPVRFGLDTTLWVGCLGVFIAMGLGFLEKDWVIGSASLLSLVFFLWALVKKRFPGVTLAIKVSIIILSLLVGSYFPWYLVVMVFYFLVARWYHRQRFRMVYPNLMYQAEDRNG
jgi:4-hydroxybenzoate polyprenyltransferase